MMGRFVIMEGFRVRGGERAVMLQVLYNISPVSVDSPDPSILLDLYSVPAGCDIHEWLELLVSKQVIERA